MATAALREQEATDVVSVMAAIGRRARAAARPLATAPTERKNAALLAMADALEKSVDAILAANALDMAAGGKAGLKDSFLDRL